MIVCAVLANVAAFNKGVAQDRLAVAATTFGLFALIGAFVAVFGGED